MRRLRRLPAPTAAAERGYCRQGLMAHDVDAIKHRRLTDQRRLTVDGRFHRHAALIKPLEIPLTVTCSELKFEFFLLMSEKTV
jgi:hypothetical protein